MAAQVADLFISVGGHDTPATVAMDTRCVILLPTMKTTVRYLRNAMLPAPAHGEHGLSAYEISLLAMSALDRPNDKVVFHSYLDPYMGYGSSAEQVRCHTCVRVYD